MNANDDVAARMRIRLADFSRGSARSGIAQLAVCLVIALALGACAASIDPPRSQGQGSSQVLPKPPVRDYPSQH